VPDGPEHNIYGVDHIVIAVRDAEEALPLWEKLLGTKGRLVTNDTVKLKEAVFWIGGIQLQLCSSTEDGRRYRKFVNERGEGLHHVGFNVHDINKALAHCKALGLPTRFRAEGPATAPWQSIDGRISFIEAETLNGVGLEFVERYTKRNPPTG
jgi:methylmalonyl-CoA/ethylmalonyl-CoA epimerase